VSLVTETDLYLRGASTLVASWDQYARAAAGATLLRSPGVAIGLFPNEPERSVYNNALFERDLPSAQRLGAVDAMESAYEQAGIPRFAAWVHEADFGMRAELERRGYDRVHSSDGDGTG